MTQRTTSWVRALVFGVALAALASGVTWATLGDGGVIYACASKSGGTLRAVDTPTGCKANETALTWNQQGPQGPIGPQGSPGPQGPQGDPGPEGPIDGLPCLRYGGTGQVGLFETHSGLSNVACVIGPQLAVDAWNNTQGTAADLTLACGGSASRTGTTMPAGTSDWFKVTFTPTTTCPGIHVSISSVGQFAHFDAVDANGTKLNGNGIDATGYEFGFSLTTPDPVWIRVWTPYVRVGWTLQVDEL